MNIMELVNNTYQGTTIQSVGLDDMGKYMQFNLDCTNGDDDCSVEQYCEN